MTAALSPTKAAALLVLSSFMDVTAADGEVTAAQVKARDFRSQAALHVNSAINVRKETTTTAVAAALVAAGEGISKDMRFKSNTAVGYFATVGMVLALGGLDGTEDGADIPEDDTAARFMWDIEKVGQKRAKALIKDSLTTADAYLLIRGEAAAIEKAEKEEKAAVKDDLHFLKAASGPIGKAIEVKQDVTTIAARDLAHELINSLIAAYGAPAAVKAA